MTDKDGIQSWNLDGKEESYDSSELGFRSTTLRGGVSQGVHLVVLKCGNARVSVLPTRGMSILNVRFEDSDVQFGWNSPIPNPVHPMCVPISEPSGLGWLSGFNEMMVRCGLESNGAPQHDERGVLQYPIHGRIGNTPAMSTRVEIDEPNGLIRFSGIVEETRFHIRRTRLTTTMTLRLANPDVLEIVDEVQNVSNRPSDFQLLYHTNIGSPVLEADAKFVSPFSLVCPRNAHAAKRMESWQEYLGADPEYQEEVYFLKMAGDSGNRTKVMLHNAAASLGFSVGYKTDQLPCFTLWKNTVGHQDGYVTGIEPGVNFPNRRQFEEEHGRVVPLAPAETKKFELTFGFHQSAESVEAVNQEIAKLSPGSPEVHAAPVADLCEP